MKFLKKKDLLNRKKYLVLEKKRLIFQFFLTYMLKKDPNNLVIKKKRILKKFFSNKTRVRFSNLCIQTSRSRGVLKKYFGSRFVLRDYMLFGLIPGIKKRVW